MQRETAKGARGPAGGAASPTPSLLGPFQDGAQAGDTLASTQASKRPEPAGRDAISFWRHRGARNIAIQAVFLVAGLAVIAYSYNNMIRGLNQLGLTFGYRFLGLEAGFAISEGIAYQPSDYYPRALLVGIVNTVKVTLAGIVATS